MEENTPVIQSEESKSYIVTITDSSSYKQLKQKEISKRLLIVVLVSIVVFLIGATVCIMAFTPVRELIPGYPNAATRHDMILNAMRLDSLEEEILLRDRYFENINAIISGEGAIEYFAMEEETGTYLSKGYIGNQQSTVTNSAEGSAIVPSVSTIPYADNVNLANIHLFSPIRGYISSHFNRAIKHYGTDIVAASNSIVYSVLDGTVIFTGWTIETGYVMAIQHTNNIISIYKHNLILFKNMGERVNAGEQIGIIGDSGEQLSSGPHLHIELWYKGQALDPEEYIIF